MSRGEGGGKSKQIVVFKRVHGQSLIASALSSILPPLLLKDRCASVRSTGLAVLSLEQSQDDVILLAARKAVQDDKAEVRLQAQPTNQPTSTCPDGAELATRLIAKCHPELLPTTWQSVSARRRLPALQPISSTSIVHLDFQDFQLKPNQTRLILTGEVICLGCAGMAGLDKRLEAELGVPVLDGVVSALKLMQALLRSPSLQA